MDVNSIEERLAAHAVEPEGEFPPEPEPATVEPDKPPESQVKTVGHVIRLLGGGSSDVVVGALKNIGALVEDGTDLVYSLHKPLAPSAGPDSDPNLRKLRFATQLTGYHKRRMARLYEAGENAVLLTWVEALTGKARGVIDRLHWIDSEACIAIAHHIEGQAGNE